MLRQIIRHSSGGQLFRLENSRLFQCSVIHRNKNNDENKDKFDEKYWNSECEDEHPVQRTYRVMNKQMREIKNRILFWRDPTPVDRDEWGVDKIDLNRHVDVAIVGSGAISNSIAYWLKRKAGESLTVYVIEPETTYSPVSPVLSIGGLQMQYSMEENIELSLHSAEFIRNINDHLGIEGEPPIDLKYHPSGCLHLSTEAGAEQLDFNVKVQRSKGVKNKILTAEQLKQKFPWLNTDGIALGCLGLQQEGWFDPDALTLAMKKKALSLGVEYTTGEVKGFIFKRTPNVGISSVYKEESYRSTDQIVIKAVNGEKQVVTYSSLVLAAGYMTSHIARLAKIGKTSGILSVPLQIEPRKRYVYTAHVPNGPGLNTPMTFDPSGFFLRRIGLDNHYLFGRNPQNVNEEPPIDDFTVDPNYFYNNVWPALSHRVPSFENVKIEKSYADYYDYNTFDETGVFGHHPWHRNMLFAAGFGVNSVSHSPAIGLAMSELIFNSSYQTIDLTRLSFDRFITLEPQMEARID